MAHTISQSLQHAIDKGYLVPLFRNEWHKLLEGKPIVTTRRIADTFPYEEIVGVWNEFITWYWYVKPTLPTDERLFITRIGTDDVQVTEDDTTITILFLREDTPVPHTGAKKQR
jgi:hypothetical protein